ncbi:hypothetical protein PT974_05728 [Cladobotryum mycophilum]|uniref:Secreted protein n=1 Tax=Cladobotryum mycophilum TaxID=491253 RepID=A0ABR0SKP9_9HYPO
MAILLGLKLLRASSLISATAGIMSPPVLLSPTSSLPSSSLSSVLSPPFYPLGGLLGLLNGVDSADTALDNHT